MIQFLPHDLTQTYPDANIEEEGRPKSSITAALYGENNDYTGQWANRPTNGKMPPVSMQYKQIKTNKSDFTPRATLLSTSMVQLSSCLTQSNIILMQQPHDYLPKCQLSEHRIFRIPT